MEPFNQYLTHILISTKFLNFLKPNFQFSKPFPMGNHSSHHTGKVVLPNGSVHVFNEPLTAAELMLDHPQQVVVEMRYKQTKPIPLAADNKLELNKVYVMLPLRRGSKLPSFSSQDAHRILVATNAVLKAQSRFTCSSRLLPLVARVCAMSGSSGQSMIKAEEDDDDDDELGFGFGKEEYLTRQVSGKGWKPSLDTIEEKREGRKEMNLVVLATKVGRRIERKGLVWG